MGASSVTGVGQGSADKTGQKGSEHLFVGVEKLIGPRIVFAHAGVVLGSNGNTSGTYAFSFPQALPGANSDYIVLTNAPAHSWATAITTSGFTANGTNGQTVSFAVVRVSNATVTSYPTHN